MLSVNSPEIIAFARKNGCSELDALAACRAVGKLSGASRALSTVFARRDDMLLVERVKG